MPSTTPDAPASSPSHARAARALAFALLAFAAAGPAAAQSIPSEAADLRLPDASALARQPGTPIPDTPPQNPRRLGDLEVPEVRSREDFFNLNRRETQIFSQWRRSTVTVLTGFTSQVTGEADFDDASGGLTVSRVGAEFGFSFRLDEDTDYVLRFLPEVSFYDFDDARGLLPNNPGVAEPFDQANALTVQQVWRVNRLEGWSWLAGLDLTTSGEPGAEFEDTMTVRGFAGASYWVTPNLRLGGVLVAASQLETGILVIPLPTIEWYPTERWSILTNQNGFSAGYHVGHLRIAGELGFERREIGLDDDGPVPSGSFSDRRLPLGVSLTYSPTRRFVLAGRAGVMLFQEIEFNTAGGGELLDEDLDPTVFGGFELRIGQLRGSAVQSAPWHRPSSDVP